MTRTAIVTGGSRGLGLALARGLVQRGWIVAADARDGAALRAALGPLGPAAIAVPGDITDASHRAALVAAAHLAGDGLDLVVNNAGGLGPSPLPALAELPVDALASLFVANVVAPLGLVQLALPALRERRGVVVDITSDASVEPYEGWGGYGATKAALDHVGRVLAVEQPTLRVLTVDPGDMRTAMHQAAFPGEDISDRPLAEASVPGIIGLIEGHRPSGRYRVADLIGASSGEVPAP